MSGWVKLHRQITDSLIFTDKPFCRGMAFIDLILMVNHEDNEIMFDGCITAVKRGQTITTFRKLSDRWGWSTTKVIKFLELLEKRNDLILESDRKKTLLTLVNYGLYQGIENTENTLKIHRKNTENTQKKQNNNDKNDNNNNIYIYSESENLNEPETPKPPDPLDTIKKQIRLELALKRIKDYFFLPNEEQIFSYIGKMPLAEFLRCIRKSANKNTAYLIQVIENRLEELQTVPEPPPKTAQNAPYRPKNTRPALTMTPGTVETLTAEEIDEIRRMAQTLDGSKK